MKLSYDRAILRFLRKAKVNGTKCDLFQSQNILKGFKEPSMLTFLIVLSENLNCGSVFFFSSLAHFDKSDYKFLRRLQGMQTNR